MTCYNLTPEQARHAASLKKGDTMVLIVPIEQPPLDWQLVEFKNPSIDSCVFALPSVCPNCREMRIPGYLLYGGGGNAVTIKLPLPIGAEVGLRETWGWIEGYGLGEHWYAYKVDGKPNIPEWQSDFKWFSSQCMPTDAIRYKGRITSSRVDRVRSHTVGEMLNSGIKLSNKGMTQDFKDYFNRRYAKPRPVKEHGKVVGYECWCWDTMSFLEFHNAVPVLRKTAAIPAKPAWKGKPLTIHVNPYVQIAAWEKE